MLAVLSQTYERTVQTYNNLCTRLYVNYWRTGEEGQGLVEYILIVLIILVTVIVALEFFFDAISGAFHRAGERINTFNP